MKNIIHKYYILILLTIICIFAIATYKEDIFSDIETLNFVAGIGFDIDTSSGSPLYSVPISVYDYSSKDGETKNYLIKSKGTSIVETKVNRQLASGKKFSLGTEKVYILSHAMSKTGILPVLDTLLNSTDVTNVTNIITTSDDPEDLLSYKTPGYPSSSDYMAGLIKSLSNFSFFEKSNSLSKAYIKNKTEGCKFITPNLEISNDRIRITSLSVFDKGKLVASIPVNYLREFNILRNTSGKGIFTYYHNKNTFLSFDSTFKRKVICNKDNNGILNFNININMVGKISNNILLDKLIISPNQKLELEHQISNQLEKRLTSFIDLMRNYYKMDFLDLGYIAASKYGRYQVTDWDKEVLKSPIKVNVDFKISKFGIGNLLFD